MRISKTDLTSIAAIGAGLVMAVGLTGVLRMASTERVVTIETDVSVVESVTEGERVARIRTSEAGIHITRCSEATDDGRPACVGFKVDPNAEPGSNAEPNPNVVTEPRLGMTTAIVRMRSDVEVPQPIVYVDGVRLENGSVEDLSPDQIERIEVVKGAAALELFGEDAHGGVIQIFLKQGEELETSDPGR